MDFVHPDELDEDNNNVVYPGVDIIWTEQWFFVKNEDKTVYEFEHKFGFVPVVWEAAYLPSPDKVVGITSMYQTSNMILTANDSLTGAVFELAKNGAAVLMFKEGSWTATNTVTDQNGFIIEKRPDGKMFIDGPELPEYLSKELETEGNLKVAMLYMELALENEKSQRGMFKQGADGSQVAESGIAKIVDMVPLTNKLTNLALKCESAVDKIMYFASEMLKVIDDHKFTFDKDYDLAPIQQKYEEIKLAQESKIWGMSETASRNQAKAVQKNYAHNNDDLNKINDEIDAFNFKPEDDLATIIKESEEEDKNTPTE
jgi:hypothetical protein